MCRSISIPFWRVVGTISVRLDPWASRCPIATYNIIDLTMGVFLVYVFVSQPEIGNLGWGFNSNVGFTMLAIFRIILCVVGAWAATGRKVRTMQVYLLIFILTPVFDFLTLTPFFNMSCDCSDYLQCQVVVSFDRKEVVNVLLDPHHFQLPPGRRLRSEGVELWHGGSNVTAVSMSLVKDMDELIESLTKNSCICDGKPFTQRHGDSCNTFLDGLEYRSWCWINKDSLDFCKEINVNVKKDPLSGRYWTYDICFAQGCKCSTVDIENRGRDCREWNNGEPEWCYVGYDSTCPDRTHAETESREVSAITSILEISQFASRIPCEQHVRRSSATSLLDAAMGRCSTICSIIIVLLLALMLLKVPLLIIMGKFLQNRCGEHFEAEAQFTVEFSSDEESDTEPDAATRRTMKRKTRRSEVELSNAGALGHRVGPIVRPHAEGACTIEDAHHVDKANGENEHSESESGWNWIGNWWSNRTEGGSTVPSTQPESTT